MTSTLAPRELPPTNVLRHGVSVMWGAVTGVAPHVLHHVGPLAGAALLAGVGGRILFFLLGLVAATPMLVRLYRRFQSWAAPVIAIFLFTLTYTLSTLYIGPLFTESRSTTGLPAASVTTTHPHDH